MTTTAHDPHDSHGEHPHAHPKFLAHHFETPQQQFDSGKLGVWLFLTTEILLFSGLFCAYAVYRASHPEIFAWAHLYLNKWYGALNTIVLIFSSFTMAWAVRASQTGERKLCVALLGITIACGGIFMCVKAVEYRDKWQEALLPGNKYNPTEGPGEIHEGHTQAQAGTENHPGTPHELGAAATTGAAHAAADTAPATQAAPVAGSVTALTQPAIAKSDAGFTVEQSIVPRASVGPQGIGEAWEKSETNRIAGHAQPAASEHVGPEPPNTHIFFGIYFLMTGLHGIHVLAGMALIAWCMVRANRGDFSPDYFSPVDFVGLYWHIVDLVWIFLFPLLYLIGNSA